MILIVFRDSVIFQIQMNTNSMGAFRATLFLNLASALIDFAATILLVNLHLYIYDNDESDVKECENDKICLLAINFQINVFIKGLIFMAFCIMHKMMMLFYHQCS